MRVRLAQFILCVALLFAANAVAHEGHDHGDDAPQVSAALPRGTASSDHFELVAILRGPSLAIYLDRFATNEPVESAKVEVETPVNLTARQRELLEEFEATFSGEDARRHSPKASTFLDGVKGFWDRMVS